MDDFTKKTNNMELKNSTSHVFSDISSEEYREYFFPEMKVGISNPTHLSVSDNGGHRVLDSSGVSHYIPPGWCHLVWKAKEGHPHFVK